MALVKQKLTGSEGKERDGKERDRGWIKRNNKNKKSFQKVN